MKSLESKITTLGREGNFEGIRKIVDGLPVKEICDMLKETMKHGNALGVLSFLMKGFSDSGPSTMKRLQVTEFILEELHGRCMQSQRVYDVVTLLITELDKYPTAHLIKIYDLCLEYMHKNSISGSCFWKDLLPKVVCILAEKDSLMYSGSEMGGDEFKEMVVNKLCRVNWKGEKIASVISLLTELSLEEKEMALVISKVGKWLQNLSASEVPPLAHQLFRLCHKGPFTLSIFLHLRDYFSKNLYSPEKPTVSSREDSESICTEMEMETHGHRSEVRLAEDTVLYHVGQSANIGSPLVKNLLTSIKGISAQPELILDPFLLTVLLHLSSVTVLQKQILDILWSVIRNCIEDEEKKIESAWYREMVPVNFQLDSILKVVIEQSASGRDRVTSGLMSLGIMLLNVSPPMGYSPPSHNSELINPDTWIKHCSSVKERMVQRAWRLGSTLLLLLAKKENSMATPVLKAILSNIIAGETPIVMAHFTGVLVKMSVSMPLMMLDNQSIFIEKISSLMLVGGDLDGDEDEGSSVCQDAVNALIPLVKISSYVRDSLVLIMRKSMFSRSILSRRVAVNGFLLMLKYLKVEELGALSQSSQTTFSAPSSSEQTCVLVHSQVAKRGNTNESTYLELLNVVRRCLVLQPEVRKCLYEGFPSAVQHNPDLGLHFLEFLYHHLVQFLVDLDKNDGNAFTSPLDWSKIVRISGKDACLKEPIASLIWCIQLLVIASSDSDNVWPSENDRVLYKIKKILKSLVVQVGKCTPSDYGLEDTYDFTAASAETEEKKILIGQLFGVHEALISYVIGSWRKDLNEPGENLLSLMNAYSRLELFVSKIKLGEADKQGKKKKDKENGDEPKKGPAGGGKSALSLIPQPILDPQCTLKFLKLLFNPISEMDMESMTTKTRQNLHTFVIKAALNHIQQARVKNFYHRQRFSSVTYCFDIISIIYEHCIANLLEYATFNKGCALLALECLCEMIAFDTNYHRLAVILDEKGILDVPSDRNGVDTPLKKFICHLQSLLEMLLDREGDEEEVEKDAWFSMPYLVTSAIVFVSAQLTPSAQQSESSKAVHPSQELLEWMLRFAKERNPKNPKVSKLVLSHSFVLGNRCHYSALELPFDGIIKQLYGEFFYGRIDEESEGGANTFKVLTDSTKSFAFSLLCNASKILLEEGDCMLKRLKSESNRLISLNEPLSGPDAEKLAELERETCSRIIHCGQIVNKLTQVATPAGALQSSILKLVVDVYSIVNQLSRYFIRKSQNRPASAKPVFEGTRFEKLVQLVGTHLSSNVTMLRSYMEECLSEGDKKKKTVKSLNASTVKCNSTLVYTTEIFEKVIIQLSKKTKVNLNQMVKLSTSRDFRIIAEKLKLATENIRSTQRNDDGDNEDEEGGSADENNEEANEEGQPAKKRARFKS
ncbi:Fanconi anemia group I protein [Ischnura elegans]|uniref:Fanconi anemia group I protein n=1 Tax=Ischnura elegans TaxID=197161 RepID=UPI001ED87C70|nr:Fanconi anemia group I protein [Ischnura elegans]